MSGFRTDENVVLMNIKRLVETFLTQDIRQELCDRAIALTNFYSGQRLSGAGLSCGQLTDAMVNHFMQVLTSNVWNAHHNGQADFVVYEMPFSFKKLRTSSDLALHWSKNSDNDASKAVFDVPIMIWIQQSSMWYKRDGESFVEAGWYFIPTHLCQTIVKFHSNNKSNTVIKKRYVYELLKTSRQLDLMIPFPSDVQHVYNFDLNSAFHSRTNEDDFRKITG